MTEQLHCGGPMTEQARGSGPPAKGPYDPDAIRERVAQAAMTEQARETPEPLTPEAERALNRLVPLLPSTARVHEDYAIIRAALRAATPDPAEPDPIETFSHPYRAPVVIDGHQYTHTSDCEWPATPDPADDGEGLFV
jgi:hypothetical protein